MIDLSEFNTVTSWAAVKRAGHTHAMIRVSYGATGVDTQGAAHIAGARAAGLSIGTYHFLEDMPISAEWANYAAHMAAPRPGDLRSCVDVESSQYSHPTSARTVAAMATWKAHLGYAPLLYANTSTLAALNLPGEYAGWPIWQADYGPNDGREHAAMVPAPWPRRAAHQYTSAGHVPGIEGDCDVSTIDDPSAAQVPTVKPGQKPKWYRITCTESGDRPYHRITTQPELFLLAHRGLKTFGPINITPLP